MMTCFLILTGVAAAAMMTEEELWDPMVVEAFDNWDGTENTKAETTTVRGRNKWRCDCWNITDVAFRVEHECRCTGKSLTVVPSDLKTPLHSLTMSNSGMKTMKKDSLQPYKDFIQDITLTEMPYLKKIERGTFKNLKQLRTIYIFNAQALKALPQKIFDGLPPTFRTLRIMRTGLEIIPELRGMGQYSIVHMIELESNKFTEIRSNTFQVKAEQLLLNDNNIQSISGWAFNDSHISKLSLRGNRHLRHLSEEAFLGIKTLHDLDLSQTAITHLPTNGLENLDILRIKDTESLKVIPSVYSFKHLKEAWLTYSFHCCAFKYPQKHDPARYALHEAYLLQMKEFCNDNDLYAGQTQEEHEEQKRHRRRKRLLEDLNFQEIQDELSTSWNMGEWDPLQFEEEHGFGALADQAWHPVTDYSIWGAQIEAAESREEAPDHGSFHQTTIRIPTEKVHALCGNITESSTIIRCYPEPNAFNPCENIMGYTWLRVAVWFVVVLAVVGNVAVLLVLLSGMSRLGVPKFLMCHLAFADLCMGAYLLILAAMDVHSSSFYFNFAYAWQFGYGCQVAGFLTVFASQLSIFTLSILTVERWFAITYAMYLNKRLKLRTAAEIMAGGWIYSIAMASFPLFGVSSYSTTSICLPMKAKTVIDIVYLISLLFINFLAFVVIVICYVQIYLSLGRDTRSTTSSPRPGAKGEMTVAKKMALLVFTDFACWAPIAFFGLTAIAGYPLIDVTKSKILLVFFYPLNSCANPYLYAILTAQYRRDFFLLLSRYGLCTKKAQQYKMTYSLPTTNNSNPIPLMVRNPDTQIVTPAMEESQLNTNTRNIKTYNTYSNGVICEDPESLHQGEIFV